MNPERPDRPHGISAQQRLAQTRGEIAALILPPAAVGARRAAARARADAETHAAMLRQRQADLAAARIEELQYDPAMPLEQQRRARAAAAAAALRGAPGFAWKPMLRRGVSIWWRHHPAHAVVEVADSMLSHVARRKPWQMLAVAAGVGALAMLVRPWRLVSVTGLALTALKMTDTRGIFGALRGD